MIKLWNKTQVKIMTLCIAIFLFIGHFYYNNLTPEAQIKAFNHAGLVVKRVAVESKKGIIVYDYARLSLLQSNNGTTLVLNVKGDKSKGTP